MKRLGLVCVIGISLILGGIFVANYWGGQKGGDFLLGPPGYEGYQEPTAKDRLRLNRSEVKQLDIENSVLKYYGDMIDYVAFAPGSGWLKIKTRDGLSPTISFNRVSNKDIQEFNRFSQSIGLPIRTEFSGNVLRLFYSYLCRGKHRYEHVVDDSGGELVP